MSASETPEIGGASGRSAAWIVALLIAAGAVALYWPVLDFDYINLDDYQYVIDNPYVLHPTASKLAAFFTEVTHPSTVAGYYQPLTMASLMLDRILSGYETPLPDPFVFHLTNVILHAVNAVLLFWLLRGLTGSTPAAALAAAVFAVHPINVESVVWICQRKTLLATGFAFAALLAYDRHVRQGGARWLIAAGVAFVLSLLSKPTGWLLPVVLMLLDAWPYRRWSARAILEKLPLLVIAAVGGWVTYVSQDRSSGLAHPAALFMPFKTLLMMSYSLTFYLSKLVWPAVLCPQYPMPAPEEVRIGTLRYGGSLVLAAALLLVLVWTLRGRIVPVTFSMFAVLLGPVLGAVHFMGTIAADRFAYLAMFAMLLLLAGLVRRRRLDEEGRRTILFVLGSLAVLGLSWKTHAQQSVWRNSMTYWREIIRQYPDDAGAYDGLGSAFLAKDDVDAALPLFERAIELRPTYGIAYHHIAHVLLLLDRPAEALEWVRRGLDVAPNDVEGQFFLGRAYSALREYDKAIEPYRRALAARPTWRKALYNLGNALVMTGRVGEALVPYARLVEIEPTNADALTNWGAALTECGYDSIAFDILRRSLALRPDDPVTLYTLARAGTAPDQDDARWAALTRAVALRPDLIESARKDPRFTLMWQSPRWRAIEASATTRPAG